MDRPKQWASSGRPSPTGNVAATRSAPCVAAASPGCRCGQARTKTRVGGSPEVTGQHQQPALTTEKSNDLRPTQPAIRDPSMSTIDPTARIEDGAVIGEGTSIGPYCIIGPHAVIGPNCKLVGHVHVTAQTTIG